MKSTGIVRRIDELGRVVVPKELRKTLRIREGDELEIFVDRESIILKKFSHFSDFTSMMEKIVEVVSHTLNKNLLIVDLDHVLSCSKSLERSYLGQSISSKLVQLITERKTYEQFSLESISFVESISEKCSYVVSPILVNGDILGAVILFDKTPMNSSDSLISQILSSFFIYSFEE